jgi:hypothetical protein
VDFGGVCWSPVDFGGVWWNLVDFGGVRWIPLDSAGFCWINEEMNFFYGKIPWTALSNFLSHHTSNDKYSGIHHTSTI